MKLHIWTDRVSYLAVAHAESVSEARELLLKESDLGESGDGSCPERDKARRAILSETSAVYVGRVAEFSLSDNAQLREQENHSEKLHQQIAAKDRRIAELEASLKRVCTEFQKVLDENDRAGIGPSADVNAEFGGDYPALDAALAAAKRLALEDAARRYEVEGMTPYSRPHVAAFLRQMAREVKS